MFLDSSDGRGPELGEKRSLGLWWTLSGSYAAQRAVRDECIEWSIVWGAGQVGKQVTVAELDSRLLVQMTGQ